LAEIVVAAPSSEASFRPDPPPREFWYFFDAMRFAYFTELQRNPIEGISVGLVDDANLFEWQCCLVGPQDTL
jgi:hypothetical protein